MRFCVEDLGARRIVSTPATSPQCDDGCVVRGWLCFQAHGVLSAEDDALVAELVRLKVCCDVCPTSNYLLSVVDSLDQHPLPQLLAAGVKCTINADDPLLFGCGLLSEFNSCRADLGMSDATLAACATTSFEQGKVMAVASVGCAGMWGA